MYESNNYNEMTLLKQFDCLTGCFIALLSMFTWTFDLIPECSLQIDNQ